MKIDEEDGKVKKEKDRREGGRGGKKEGRLKDRGKGKNRYNHIDGRSGRNGL